MLRNVFYDLRSFLLFYLIVLSFFGVCMSILVQLGDEDYNGLGKLAYLAISLRTAVGDNEMSDYADKTEYPELAWIIWLVTLVVGNVVFMNFIIAVVSQSYENCMSKMEAQSYKVKVDLIVEREAMLSHYPSEWFPRFILLRKPEGVNNGGGSEWQGLVKEIKLNQAKEIATVRESLLKQMQRDKLHIDKVESEVSKVGKSVEKCTNEMEAMKADNKEMLKVMKRLEQLMVDKKQKKTAFK